MKKIVFLFCMVAALKLTAQRGDTAFNPKPFFYSANQIGLLEGSRGSAFLLQTVNGVQHRNWGLGLGVGIDKYGSRSIPVFLAIQRRLPAKRLPIFVYADAGLNIPWLYNAQTQWVNSNTKNGLYFDGGLQYHWLMQKRKGLIFSLGYTEKRYREDQTTPVACITTPCPELKNTWWYTYRRIAAKAGWRF